MNHSRTLFSPWHIELIAGSAVARLATIAASGAPHLVPVCFALVEGRFAIAVDEKPKREGELARVRNIRRDGRVTLLIDRYADDWEQLMWVRIDGSGRILDRGDAWPEALTALREKYPQYRSMELEGRLLIAITPLRVASWRWHEAAPPIVPPA